MAQCQLKQTARKEVRVGVPEILPVSGFRCIPLGSWGWISNSCSRSSLASVSVPARNRKSVSFVLVCGGGDHARGSLEEEDEEEEEEEERRQQQ
jgi:hypothetical protein